MIERAMFGRNHRGGASRIGDDQMTAEGEPNLELQALHLMAAGATLTTVLDALAQAGTGIGDARACVIMVDRGTERLRIGGSAGLGSEHGFALDGTAIALDGGPCGRAAYLNRLVVADRSDARSPEVRLAARLGGDRCWALPLPKGRNGRCAGAILVVSDLSAPSDSQREGASRLAALVAIAIDRDRDQAELLHRAGHDRLTGLVNRTVVLERLGVALERTRPGAEVAVLLVDVDGFRLINDNMGHEVGDRVLMALADRLRRATPHSGAVGRLGSDEFVVLFESLGTGADAMTIASRLMEVLARPLVLLGRELRITVSIGVALGTNRSRPERLLHEAALAASAAKRRAPNSVELSDEPSTSTAEFQPDSAVPGMS